MEGEGGRERALTGGSGNGGGINCRCRDIRQQKKGSFGTFLSLQAAFTSPRRIKKINIIRFVEHDKKEGGKKKHGNKERGNRTRVENKRVCPPSLLYERILESPSSRLP